MAGAEDKFQTILERLAALEKRAADDRVLLEENRRLILDLRRKESEAAGKDLEIERLKRDIYYQKRLCEKEIEDRLRGLEERRRLLDEEVAEKIGQEKEQYERRLAVEQSLWSEKLAREREECDRKLAEALRRESLWSRLVRMLTWS